MPAPCVDRGAWPFVLAIRLFFGAVYAVLFALVMRLGRPFGWRLLIGFNLTVGAIMVVHAGAYFALKPDWGEVSAGREQLSLLQQLVYGKVIGLLIYPVPLLVAAFLMFFVRL